jgi:hypothetical protein
VDRFVVRSPALLDLASDWARAGVPLGETLDVIGVLFDDLGVLAGKLADLIVRRLWEQASAASRAAELNGLLLRGRPLMLQGAASTFADRLGAALVERAATADDGDTLRAALEKIRVRALADSAGTIHRQEA